MTPPNHNTKKHVERWREPRNRVPHDYTLPLTHYSEHGRVLYHIQVASEYFHLRTVEITPNGKMRFL